MILKSPIQMVVILKGKCFFLREDGLCYFLISGPSKCLGICYNFFQIKGKQIIEYYDFIKGKLPKDRIRKHSVELQTTLKEVPSISEDILFG